ncbi:amidohydrolase family protein [Aurantiacibacter poecillastricola]|uniref:amidohydrolase family protein n=1 Tax=Aurantiacibacter poecillastricola TaxID=3064385 RepID=UPI00273F96DB|nr:amidohydrolase family protein [Aurantiacibacter sp. 219JJ12-13]MDP5263247.1 amidohydrolase family protein [Aurantiacibacter sp. 219JJ12-13]
MEIIDGQIHNPAIGGGRTGEIPDGMTMSDEQELFVEVELAREAIGAAGVDRAIVFANHAFNQAATRYYPELFRAVEVLDYGAADLEEQMARLAADPGTVGTRALFTNFGQVWRQPGGVLELNPLIAQGAYDNYFAMAAKYDVPMFLGAHKFASEASVFAERHPEMTLIVDHFGVTQSLLEPPADRWDALPNLLEMARYPNVYVKMCGTPIISEQEYPYRDIWPYMHQILHAFGAERCLWASDYTRQRWGTETPLGPDGQPRREDWIPYANALNYILLTNELSESDKEWVLGKTVRRALKLDWPEVS